VNTYDVHVKRGDAYWLLHVPAISRSTQARTLREIEPMARDLIAVMLDADPDSFGVDIDIAMPVDAAEHLRRAEQLRATAAQAQHDAADEVRAAARSLKSTGMPLRDLGRLLGVSFQRAGQLVKPSQEDEPERTRQSTRA
jgi:hypothetical protein